MATPFLGEITMFGGNFAPRGNAFCNGQIMVIAQNDALYSLLGTVYGGNGVTTFGLPDLRGRLPIHQGQLAGGGSYVLGQVAGTETVTLTSQQLPVHTHGAIGAAAAGTTGVPANNFWAADPGGEVAQFSNVAPTAAMSPQAIAPAGGNQPHENIHPFLCISFVIALEGIYPPQN